MRRSKFAGKPHISGTKGGHTINLHQFARDGVTLLGRLEAIDGSIVKLKGDLYDNLSPKTDLPAPWSSPPRLPPSS